MSLSQTPDGDSPKVGQGSHFEPFPTDDTLTFRQIAQSFSLPNIQVNTDLSSVSEEDLPLWLNGQLEIIGETFSRANFRFFDDLIDSLGADSSVEEILKVARVLCLSSKDPLMTNNIEQAIGRKIRGVADFDSIPETSGPIAVLLEGSHGSVIHPVHLLEHALSFCNDDFIRELEKKSYIESLVQISSHIYRVPLRDATNEQLGESASIPCLHHMTRIVGMRPKSLPCFLNSLKKEIVLTFLTEDKQASYIDINAGIPVLLSQLITAHKDAGREVAQFILAQIDSSEINQAPLFCALINQIQQIGNRSLVHDPYTARKLISLNSFDKAIEDYFSETLAHIVSPVNKAIQKGEYDRYVELLLLMSALMPVLEDKLIEFVRDGKIEQTRFSRSFLRPQGVTDQFAECRAYIAERMILAFSDRSKDKAQDLLRSFKTFENQDEYWITPVNIQFQLLPHLSDEQQGDFLIHLKDRVVKELEDDELRMSVLSALLPKISLFLSHEGCDDLMVLLCYDILKALLDVPDECFLSLNWKGQPLYTSFEQILGRLWNRKQDSSDIDFEILYTKHNDILSKRYWSDILREAEVDYAHPGITVIQEDNKVITVLTVGPGEQESAFARLLGSDLRNRATIFVNPVKPLRPFMEALADIDWAGGERLFMPIMTAEQDDGREIIANFFRAIGSKDDRVALIPTIERYRDTSKDLISETQTLVLPLLNNLIGFFDSTSQDIDQDRIIPQAELAAGALINKPEEVAKAYGDIFTLGMESLTTPTKIILVETTRSEFSEQMVRCFTGLEEFAEDCIFRHLAKHPDILILREYIPGEES